MLWRFVTLFLIVLIIHCLNLLVFFFAFNLKEPLCSVDTLIIGLIMMIEATDCEFLTGKQR